ncbi:MAG: 3-hydroxyacyl-CoA dehydrogenase, partial [Clostridia bacterium]|nr:3-hydroxyacyl-CoA dehydrogenase [Clostridia bacterium]
MGSNIASIAKIAVIGAGVMGRGIAHVAALAGYETRLQDISEQVLEDALKVIGKNMAKGVELGKLSDKEKEEALARISRHTELAEAVKDVDLVIEAVPEIMELKHNIFAQLDRLTPPHAILATNTSTMSPTEIASATKRPEQVIAMHFFNPVHKMKLLEIIKGLDTGEATVQTAVEVGKKMGKETVVINEFPGFITSRISSLVGNEAFYMLQEGIASPEEIDKAVKLGLNYPMGPLELGDLVGLDVRLRNLEYLHATLGEKFRPCPLLVKYVKAGRLGRKTGKGVYVYDSYGGEPPVQLDNI